MPTPPEGTPWWAWLLGLLIIFGGPAVASWLAGRKTRADVREIKEQVKNTHESNLRVDMDATREVAGAALEQAKLGAESSHRTERLAEDLIRSIRAMEHSMDRRDKLQTDALNEVRGDLGDHLADVPRILEDAFARHVDDCPLRASKS